MQYLEMRKGRVEIIPMIDIMFFLLIFFIMITLHMIPSSGIASSLAKSSTAMQLNQPKVVLSVDGQGNIGFDGRTVSPSELTAMLQQKGSDTVVTIAGAKDTSLQHLMAVMDACRAAGVTQIGLAARKE